MMLTMADIASFTVPAGAVALWWLGQSGFIIKSPGGRVIVMDPYLSNSCKAVGESVGVNMDRMVPPPMTGDALVGIDAYLMTHSHQDHLDPDTLRDYRNAGGRGPYIAPGETVNLLASLGVPAAECRTIQPNGVVQIDDLTIRATFAIPLGGDDLTHVGYIVMIENGPAVYFTGDTAYHPVLSAAVKPLNPDVLVAVINGAFRNMSPADAATLAAELDVKQVIPCHYDLFPDNSVPPRLLRTNLLLHGMMGRYTELAHATPWVYRRNP
jgi:L-ascorbate 6-phosphate lactonase